MEIMEVGAVVEAMLFAAGDIVPLDRLSELIEIDKKTLKGIMNNLIDQYATSPRGIMIREINNGYQLCTKQDYYEYVQKMVEPRMKQNLSQAAFETLSIVAYKQPATKAKIEKVRGVSSDSAVAKLLERNLIKEAGRLDAPGKPILYETTEEFLRAFGFKTIGDLPILSLNDSIEEQLEEDK